MARPTVFAFLPTFLLSRLLGGIGFTWPVKGHSGYFHCKISASFLFVILLCSIHSQVTNYLKIVPILIELPGPALLDAVVVRFIIFVHDFPIAALILSVLFKASNFHRLILTLIHVDKILHNSYYEKIKLKCNLITITFLTLWTLIFISLLISKRLQPWDYLPYVASLLTVLCAEQNLIIISYIIKVRFEYINLQFKAMKIETFRLSSLIGGWMEEGIKTTHTARILAVRCRKMRLAHATLCDATRDLDTIYRGPLLMIMLLHFCSIVGSIFLLYVFTMGSGVYDKSAKVLLKRPDKSRLLTITFTLLFSTLRLLMLVWNCEGAVSEARRTGELIYRVEWHPEMVKEMQKIAGQLQMERLGITGGGMFTVDLSLLFVIGGAITSYLMILIQFQSIKTTYSEKIPLVCGGGE